MTHTDQPASTKKQIRGSSLLLVGRFLSMGVNFVVQVLIVRHLTQGEFGAFSYALTFVAMGESLATFGLDRAITRFVPIYHEREDYPRLFGAIVMVVGSVIGLGVAVVVAVLGLQGFIGGTLIDDPLAVQLLVILVFLAPIQAFDEVLVGLFAVFANPRAIFFRKHVVGPALKLAVVLVLVAWGSDAAFLASGYVLAGALGIAIYTVVLARELAGTGLLQHFRAKDVRYPVGEVLAFTVPLLSSELVYTSMASMDTLILGHFHGTEVVAAYRVVYPAARLNQVVLSSFGLLFTPAAARMFAREDRSGINELYWRNATWIAVMSFPVFAATFALARPVTELLYGARYADSWVFLALLSLGYYFNAALGQNGLTLKVFGKVRYVVAVNVATALFNVAAGLLLIPRYGAIGAAVGTCATLVVFNVLKQAGLRLGTGIRLFDPRFGRAYAPIAGGAAGLLFLQIVTDAPVPVAVAFGAAASLVVLRSSRTVLDIEKMFPEILRIPLVRPLLGLPPRAGTLDP
ncbi:hypothetical protein DCC79_16265 [bacterium]|nr:flippase [Chloroflexi bacterium CFX6]RIL05137.1 MAG: hypothetical protein DCC79_16265 [bacterium]